MCKKKIKTKINLKVVGVKMILFLLINPEKVTCHWGFCTSSYQLTSGKLSNVFQIDLMPDVHVPKTPHCPCARLSSQEHLCHLDDL